MGFLVSDFMGKAIPIYAEVSGQGQMSQKVLALLVFLFSLLLESCSLFTFGVTF